MRSEHEGSGKRCSTTCETLVYTRSRVRIALDRLPAGQFAVVLHTLKYAKKTVQLLQTISVETAYHTGGSVPAHLCGSQAARSVATQIPEMTEGMETFVYNPHRKTNIRKDRPKRKKRSNW